MDELLPEKNAQTVSVLHAPAPGGSSWPSSTPGPGLRGLPRNAPTPGHAVFWLFSRLRDATLISRRGLGLEGGGLGVGQPGQAQDAMSLRRGMAGLGEADNGTMKPLRPGLGLSEQIQEVAFFI